MSAPMGPPSRRTPCPECGKRSHTARAHEPGGILYAAPPPQDGPDLLVELAEVERTPAEVLADAVESVRTSDQAPAPAADLLEPLLESVKAAQASRTAQQLADAETAAARLEQARRFITPAGEVKTISGPDATPERQQFLCRDGAWSRNPETGAWSCAECGKPAAAPVLAEIEAMQDDAPGVLVAVDLPPLQPRARWAIEGASPILSKPEDAQVEAPADCDCCGDGDLHPVGSGGCLVTSDAAEQLLDDVEPDDDELPCPCDSWEVQADGSGICNDCGEEVGGPGSNDLPWEDDLDTGEQHGPEAFGPPWSTGAGPHAAPRITLPGVYHLTDREYHDPAVTGDWVSNSDLKAMSLPGAPAKWKYNRDNGVRDERDVFQFGKAAHAEVLGVGAGVAVRPATWSDWRKQAAKDWRAEQQAAGLVVVTPDEWEIVLGMAAAMRDHPEARALLGRPGRAEVALFWVERLPSGRMVKRRAMLDFLPDYGPIVDYKTCDVAAPDDQLSRAISRYRYHRQAATYIAAVEHLGLPADPDAVFLFQEKSPPYLVTPVNLDDPTMMAAEIQNRQALEVYAECLESGVWPGYTDTTVTMSIPEYELREYEQEIK